MPETVFSNEIWEKLLYKFWGQYECYERVNIGNGKSALVTY